MVIGNCFQYQENLNLHALGLLEGENAVALQQHLDSGCASCREEYKEIQEALSLLPYQLPQLHPAPDLKARLFTNIRAMTPVVSTVMNFDLLEWEDSDLPGVSFHWLRRDESGTTAALVRIRAGAHFMDHKHVGAEDCLVLRGKLRDSRGVYNAGDYVYYEAGSIQKDVTAIGEDCVIFVVNHNGIEPLA